VGTRPLLHGVGHDTSRRGHALPLTRPGLGQVWQLRSGDFCLYYYGYVNKYGGIYHYGGSDSDLRNDRFERNHTNTGVANNAAAAWVNGRANVKDDVIIYRRPGHRGADACIKRGDSGMLPIDTWSNKVQSYKWATNAQCRAAGVIDL
jgi:hypothetical protein